MLTFYIVRSIHLFNKLIILESKILNYEKIYKKNATNIVNNTFCNYCSK